MQYTGTVSSLAAPGNGRRLPVAAWLLLFIGVQTLAVAWLWQRGASVGLLVVKISLLGLLLPGLTALATWGLPRAGEPAAWRRQEAALIVALLLWCALAMGPLKQAFDVVAPARATFAGEVVNTSYKLAVFVAVPWLVLRWCGAGLAGVGQVPLGGWAVSRVLLAMAALAWIVQALIGNQFRGFLQSHGNSWGWLGWLPLVWVWLSLEAGLVEEFFFRRWLQSRLAAALASPWAAVLLSALLFGLAHVPGLWLRGGGATEGLGSTPSLADCIAYALTTQALAGLMFGVLWQRTRNLPLCIAVHGMFDTPAHVGKAAQLFGF